MKSAVLDSSAVIALLMAERGADKVRDRLREAVVSSVNLAEVVAYFARNGAAENAIAELIGSLSLDVAPFDQRLATATGMLIATTRAAGLSLGDCACLALAADRGADALTADRAWLKIGDSLRVDIVIIR